MTKQTSEGIEFLEWIKFYLRVTGIQPTSPLVDSLLFVFCTLVLGVGSAACWVLFFQRFSDFSVNIEIVFPAVLNAHSLFLYLVYVRNRSSLVEIVETIKMEFSLKDKLCLSNQQEVWAKADKLSLMVMKFGFYGCVVIFFCYILNASPFSGQRKLLFPMWIPFHLHQEVLYFLTLGFQLSVGFVHTVINVAGCGVLIGGSHFIGASFDALGLAFIEICQEGEMPENNGDQCLRSVKQQTVAEEKLKLWVERHIAVLRLLDKYKYVFGKILLEVVLCCELFICFSGFQVVLAVEVQDMQKAFTLTGMVLLMVFHLFMFCYPGQNIYNKSEDLRTTIYWTPWETQSLKFRKLFAVVLTQTVRPVVLSYRGIVTSSMPLFLTALRTAYSYENILLLLREFVNNESDDHIETSN